MNNNKSILIFGAGKIGRSFIGQLFGQGGYEIIFVDIDFDVVNALNQRKSYPVVIKDESEETILVQNVRAISGLDKLQVINEIEQSSVLAVSVGKNALAQVLPLIANGLIKRYKTNPGLPLDIIIAENMRSSAEFIFKNLSSLLPANYPIIQLVGLVETSIGKMVPLMTAADLQADSLQVFAEPYNDLILDKHGFKGEIPNVKGLSLKENIRAWVDRKAFVHNMSHATVAYASAFYHPEYQYLHEVLNHENIFSFAKTVMLQASEVLIQYYPHDFTLKDLELHINDLLFRFQNKALKDTVFRVGQDLSRKLNRNDRFAGIIQMAKEKGLAYNHILEAMALGFFFNKRNEQGERSAQDDKFIKIKNIGIKNVLVEMCGFAPQRDSSLINELEKRHAELKNYRSKKISNSNFKNDI